MSNRLRELIGTINRQEIRELPGVNFICGEYILNESTFDEIFLNKCDHFIETKDKLSLLRSCLELLNSLEGTILDRFAGKVLLFLARALPLFDQSGLNQRSEFSIKELPNRVNEHLLKITTENSKNVRLSSDAMDQDMEEGETLSDDDSNDTIPKDDIERIYERFWKVQYLLYNPNQLYEKNAWFTFRTHVDALIHKFESCPATIKFRKIRNTYMTEPEAFKLQLEDINMRRCFLIQLLIVLQYLEMPSDMKADNFVLDKVQMSWSLSMIKRIYGLLDSMASDDGRNFLNLVRQLLRREEMWNRWKNDKCREPKRPESENGDIVSFRGTYHKRRKISDELKSAQAYDMHVIGSQEMSRLWNMKPSKEYSPPDLLTYLDLPPEKQADSYKDPNYSFRVLRLLRKNPHFFEQTSAAIQSLDVYLKNASARILVQQNQTTG